MGAGRALRQEDMWRPNQGPLGLSLHPGLTVPSGCSRNKHPLTSPPPLFAPPYSLPFHPDYPSSPLPGEPHTTHDPRQQHLHVYQPGGPSPFCLTSSPSVSNLSHASPGELRSALQDRWAGGSGGPGSLRGEGKASPLFSVNGTLLQIYLVLRIRL